jgi:protein-disulfide isomerase
MNKFIIEKNDFLSRNIPAFYNKDYIGYGRPNNPDFINVLKNTYNSYSVDILKNAINELEKVLNDIFDIAYTHAEFNFDGH